MKQLNRFISRTVLTPARGAFLAGLATLAVIALAGAALLAPTRAAGTAQTASNAGNSRADEAAILDVLSGYHGALAYGGDIQLMASLWADDSLLTLNNGAPYVGKDAVLGFFANGPYFHNYWVSLAPEWKTTVTVLGNRAQTTTECIATDMSVTPHVIKGVIQVNATLEKQKGQWVFIQMDNYTVPDL